MDKEHLAKLGNNKVEHRYEIYCKFNDEEESVLMNGFDKDKTLTLTLPADDGSAITFTTASGNKFTLGARKQT